MRDGLFYAVSLAVAGAIVALALSFGESPDIIIQDICENGIELKGDDLNRLVQVDGTNIGFVQATANDPAHMIMDAPVARALATPSAGIFMPITEAYGEILRGKRITLTTRARQHFTQPLEEFEAAYFSTHFGNSGWKKFSLSNEFQNYSFDMPLRNYEGELDLDYFGIWPGVEGEGLKMDVESMRIDITSGC